MSNGSRAISIAGRATIFVFRFMPFGRTIISLPAGLMHMPFWRFCAYTAAGSAIWNAALVGVGYGLVGGGSGDRRFVTPAIVFRGCRDADLLRVRV